VGGGGGRGGGGEERVAFVNLNISFRSLNQTQLMRMAPLEVEWQDETSSWKLTFAGETFQQKLIYCFGVNRLPLTGDWSIHES